LFRPLIKKANRALLLTGSPALSRPIELHTQVNFICPGLLGKKKWYGLRYCGARETQYGWESGMKYPFLFLEHIANA